jgi:hypothetical protein
VRVLHNKITRPSRLLTRDAYQQWENYLRLFALGILVFTGLTRATAEEPQWLLDARAKEGELTKPHLVISADKRISFSVPAALSGKLKETKNYYEALITLGPDAVADCEIFNTAIDPAALLRDTARTTFSEVIEKSQGKIEQKNLENIDAGVAGATPYLSLAWRYQINDVKGASVGGLRQYAAGMPRHGIYCELNDLGYAKTFEKVVIALISSLKTQNDEEIGYFSQVSVTSILGIRIGFSALNMHRDGSGGTIAVETNSLLTPVALDALKSRDTFYVEYIKPDGTMINANRIVSSNGEIETDLDLKKGGRKSWVVEGKLNGKDIKETIAGGAPSTYLATTRLMRSLLTKEIRIGKQVTEVAWLADHPRQLTPMTIKVLAVTDANSVSVRQSAGNDSLDVVVDRATGEPIRGVAHPGSAEIKFERIYVQGSQ